MYYIFTPGISRFLRNPRTPRVLLGLRSRYFVPMSTNRFETDRSTEDWVTPPELKSRVASYAAKILHESGDRIAELPLERIDWTISRQLYRAGGKCTTQFGEPPRHEITISYPAYRYWGWNRIAGIVRHELAHAATHEVYGADVEPHGPEFRSIATEMDAPLRGEEPLPYRFELYCSRCDQFVDGLYERSSRIEAPHQYYSDCCDSTLRVEESTSYYDY